MSDRPYSRSDTLKCGWYMLQVMADETLGVVIPRLHSPDMSGCIQMAKAVMPDVSAIYVFNEVVKSEACETVYKLTRKGTAPPEWEAFDTRTTNQ